MTCSSPQLMITHSLENNGQKKHRTVVRSDHRSQRVFDPLSHSQVKERSPLASSLPYTNTPYIQAAHHTFTIHSCTFRQLSLLASRIVESTTLPKESHTPILRSLPSVASLFFLQDSLC